MIVQVRRVSLFGRDSLCGVMVMLASSFALAGGMVDFDEAGH